MYELISLIEEIGSLAQSPLIRIQEGVFGELSLRNPEFAPAKLGLLETVSWLYVLYNEVGKVNVEFLIERLVAYDLDLQNKHAEHFHIVHDLRTYFQHHLTPSELRSLSIQEACQQWFHERCETTVPRKEEEWKDCLIGLLNEALNFLQTLGECIRSIERDESREQILRQWEFRRFRYHPPHEFDRLIEEVAADMGRESIEAIRLRRSFYDKWIKELELLGNYDFKVEARKQIEHALLSETIAILPITGNDIMEEFNLKPGREVGELLKRAQTLYQADPCTREALLEKLRQKINANEPVEPE